VVKLHGGEYIALEHLESTYKSCNFVQNICVYEHPEARRPMAIIISHEAQLRQFLKTVQPHAGVDENDSLEPLCRSDTVWNFVLNICNAVGF
jgi:long-chain acyl-CoA synthetase